MKRRALAITVILLRAAAARAQAVDDLRNLAIEDLMRIEVQRVFGASERIQPVTEAPSSVSIVTSDDITRYGYRSLADILRSVRGFYVTNDRNYSYIGVRGFARAGDYNTRILLLVNGHRVNDDVYDQAAIGSELGIDVAMFDRVEIIRGPASSLYGTSAFFAVVNVITRNGASLDGLHLDVDGGTLGTSVARLAGGRQFANGVDLALSGTLDQTDGEQQLYYPAFDSPATNFGVAEHLDGERMGSAYGHLTAGHFAFTFTFGRRRKDVPTASYGTIFNEQDHPERTIDTRTTVTGEYTRNYGNTRLAVDLGLDRSDYQGTYAFTSDNPMDPVLLQQDSSSGIRMTAGVRVSRKLPGRQTVSVGGIVNDNLRQHQWFAYEDESLGSTDLPHASVNAGVYAQDEVRVRPWLLLNGGVRYDRYEQFSRATPRGAVIVTPGSGTSFKYLYGEAFRAPNAYELYYYGTTPPDLRPEFIRTHEVVWEQYASEWLRTSVSAYHYTASQLITFTSLDSNVVHGRYGFVNTGAINADGVEFEAELRATTGLQAGMSYVRQNTHQLGMEGPLANSPPQMVKVRATVPLPRRSFASAEWQMLGARATLAGSTVSPESVVRLTAGWPLTRQLTLTGTIANVFDQRYADPGSDEHLQDTIQQTGRTARVGFRWKLPVW